VRAFNFSKKSSARFFVDVAESAQIACARAALMRRAWTPLLTPFSKAEALKKSGQTKPPVWAGVT
jgi:hypothetical protein